MSPLGLLRNCLDYALNDAANLTGVFEAIREEFRMAGARSLLDAVQTVNDFRNTRVAHQEIPLTDLAEARKALVQWVSALAVLWKEVAE